MSDDLVERLRDVAEATGPNEARRIALDAADRIEQLAATNEELEAKLVLSEGALDVASKLWGECQRILEQTEAKLIKAEQFIVFLDENYRHVFGDTARQKIRELYAELKGKADE